MHTVRTIRRVLKHCVVLYKSRTDQGYGRGGTPVFSGVFEPVARVALFPTDENGLGSCFIAA